MGRHSSPSPLAGKTVKLKDLPSLGSLAGKEYRVEDWWDCVAGKSWSACTGNAACLNYAARSGFAGLPLDDEVLYGKVGSLGHLIHVSEVEADENPQRTEQGATQAKRTGADTPGEK